MGEMKAAGTAISPTNADLTSEFAICVSGDSEIPADLRSVTSCSQRYSLSLMWREIHTVVLSIIVDTFSQKIYKPASIYYSTYSLR